MRHFLAAALAVLATQADAVTVSIGDDGRTTYTYDESIDGELSGERPTVPIYSLGWFERLRIVGTISSIDDLDRFLVDYGTVERAQVASNEDPFRVRNGISRIGTMEVFLLRDQAFGYPIPYAYTFDIFTRRQPNPVPLPASGLLLLAGLAGLALRARRAR